jgi:hypothetical protein
LFRKNCFANQNYLSALKFNIISEKYPKRRKVNLHSNKIKWYSMIWEIFEYFGNNKFEDSRDIENQKLALRVVPFPEFTINCVSHLKRNLFLNIILFLFIPRFYRISWKDWNKLGSFFRIVRYEHNDDIYDNPAIEATIHFCWKRARTYFFSLFLRFLLYIFCFGLISWAYLDHSVIISVNFLFTLIVIYYYLAIYLFITEIIQLTYQWRRYISDICNFFDILSIIFPVIVMSIMLKDFRFSDGFGSVETSDSGLIALISFSAFFLWIDMVSLFFCDLHLSVIILLY